MVMLLLLLNNMAAESLADLIRIPVVFDILVKQPLVVEINYLRGISSDSFQLL